MKTNSTKIQQQISFRENLLKNREKTVAIAWRWLHIFGKCAPKEKVDRIGRHIRELIPSIIIMRYEIRELKTTPYN